MFVELHKINKKFKSLIISDLLDLLKNKNLDGFVGFDDVIESVGNIELNNEKIYGNKYNFDNRLYKIKKKGFYDYEKRKDKS